MKEKKQICKKWLFVIVAMGILFALITTACSESKNSSQSNTTGAKNISSPIPQSASVSKPVNLNWNMLDSNAFTNGNVKIASDAISHVKNSDLKKQSQVIDPADGLASPSKYYGKFIKFKGIVLSDMTYEKMSNIASQLGLNEVQEMHLKADNGTYIDFLNIVPVKQGILINGTVSIYGYIAGSISTSDKSGKKINEISFVGNLLENQ